MTLSWVQVALQWQCSHMCQALQSIEQCVVIWQILSYTEAAWQSAEGIYVELHSAHLRSVTGWKLQWPMHCNGHIWHSAQSIRWAQLLMKLLQWSNSGYWVSSPIVAIKYCQVGQYCNASILYFASVCSVLEVWHQPLHFWWSAAMGGILGRCIALEHPSSFTSYSCFHLCLL